MNLLSTLGRLPGLISIETSFLLRELKEVGAGTTLKSTLKALMSPSYSSFNISHNLALPRFFPSSTAQ
jgi:hypothetical protein